MISLKIIQMLVYSFKYLLFNDFFGFFINNFKLFPGASSATYPLPQRDIQLVPHVRVRRVHLDQVHSLADIR